MAEQSDESLIREIDDELRQEQFQKAWTQYGKAIIAAAVLVVAGVAGYQIWRNVDQSNRLALGDQFASAQKLALEGNQEAAQKGFAALAGEDGGYGLLARFQQARLLASQGDQAGAVAIYDKIRADGGADALYKDLADLLAANLLINSGSADPASIKSRLDRLTSAGNPWRFTAKELQAALALKSGDKAGAVAVYEDLSKDAGAPPALRQRAAEMLTILR